MSPSQAIAMLDRQIAAHGQEVILHSGGQEYAMRAFVRGYSPQEVGDGIQIGTSTAVLSPTQLAASGFPAGEYPQRLDGITINGRLRNVEVLDPVLIANTPVRFDVTVSG